MTAGVHSIRTQIAAKVDIRTSISIALQISSNPSIRKNADSIENVSVARESRLSRHRRRWPSGPCASFKTDDSRSQSGRPSKHHTEQYKLTKAASSFRDFIPSL